MAIASVLGEPDIRGDEYNFVCPWCASDPGGKRKLGVNAEKEVFNCFRCHCRGTLRSLFVKLDLPLSFNAEMPVELISTIPEVQRETPKEIPGFVPLTLTDHSSTAMECFDLLRNRAGIVRDSACDLGWGYSTDVRLFGRLIIPIRMNGRLVNYLARSLYPWLTPKERGGAIKAGWLPRSELYYGFLPPECPVILVEGIWDYMAVERAMKGIEGVPIALLGTNLSDVQLGLILSTTPTIITIFFDGDEAGWSASKAALKKIKTRAPELKVRIASCPQGHDPDDLSDELIRACISGGSEP